MVCTYCERNRLFRHLRRVDAVARTQAGTANQLSRLIFRGGDLE